MTAHISRKLIEPRQDSFPNERADAVRYAVLQRIAPALRHDMVVNLQPIGMIYELMEHRLAHQEVDVSMLQESSAKMSRFARAALTSCTHTATWLERDPQATTSLAEGVGESAALLGRAFGFMGFKLINKVRDDAPSVPRDALRHTLTAALLAAVDTAHDPSDVVLSSSLGAKDIALSIAVVAQPGKRLQQAFEPAYRRLVWHDVEAVATAESIGFARRDGVATLSFPR